MTCPSCGVRRAKRACPALGRDICPTCCGTKRLTEIACPSDCGYLASARNHPAATVLRQRERDFRFLYEMIHGLPQASFDLLLALQDAIRRYQPAAVPALVDDDVRDAAGALASTLETSAKGIIYEHQPSSLPAQRVLAELRRTLEAVSRSTGQFGQVERAAAGALRRIERAAREAKGRIDETARAYLGLLDRLPSDLGQAATTTGSAEAPAPDATGPRLIVP